MTETVHRILDDVIGVRCKHGVHTPPNSTGVTSYCAACRTEAVIEGLQKVQKECSGYGHESAERMTRVFEEAFPELAMKFKEGDVN